MQLDRVANHPGLDHLDGPAQTALGASLVAHLRGQLVFRRHLSHQPRFIHRLDQRLLAEAVLAQLHGPEGRRAVIVVGVDTVTASMSFPISSSIFR